MPLHGQPVDVVPIDLVQRTVAVPRVAAMVGRPVDVRFYRRLAVGVALAAEQHDVAPGRPELRVEPAFVEDGAFRRIPPESGMEAARGRGARGSLAAVGAAAASSLRDTTLVAANVLLTSRGAMGYRSSRWLEDSVPKG